MQLANILSRNRSIVLECCLMYGAVGLIVTMGMLLSNLYVSHASKLQFQQTMINVAQGYALLLVVLIVYTYIRLYRQFRPDGQVDSDQRRWQRLASFPGELFWLYWLAGFLIAETQRFILIGLPPWSADRMLEVYKGILFDGSTFLAFAIIHYSLARWILRRELMRYPIYNMTADPRFYEMSRRLVAIVACGLLYMQLRLFWHVYQGSVKGLETQWSVITAITVVIMLIALLALKIGTSYLLTDIHLVERSLLRLTLDQAEQLKPLPIVSPYEAGRLTLAFNRLQERFAEEYGRLQQEIGLARSVQRQLFPPERLSVASWNIATARHESSAEPKLALSQLVQASADTSVAESDGDGDSKGYIYIIGIALSGNEMSSALIIPMLLMDFRAQARQYPTAAAMLHHLKDRLEGRLPEDMRADLAVIALDIASDELTWAMSGQLRIVMQPVDGLQQVETGSFGKASAGELNRMAALSGLAHFQVQYARSIEKPSPSSLPSPSANQEWGTLVSCQRAEEVLA